VLLLAYSIGLAVPFLASALLVERFLGFFAAMRSRLVWISRISGVLMIAVGLLLVTSWFTLLASGLQAMTPEFIRSRI
jgi:cytochrome c-type biogenesis protein